MKGRVALVRLAARDARRHRGRSALVLAMVALPVIGLAAIDVVQRTAAAETHPQRQIPDAADATAQYVGGPVLQTPDGQSTAYVGDNRGTEPTDDDVRREFAATGVLMKRSAPGRLAAPEGRSVRIDLREIDYRSPLAAGQVKQLTGAAPTDARQIVLTQAAALAAHADIGSVVHLLQPDRAFTLVGIVQVPDADRRAAVGLPGALIPAAQPVVQTSWSLRTPHPVTWQQVVRGNEHGFIVVSRAVLADPPARSQVPYYRQLDATPTGRRDTVELAVLVAGMGLLETVLLAGPAFAVGARRSRRTLALLAAVGGDRRHVRDVVLAQGLVLGATASAGGVAVGTIVGVVAQHLIQQHSADVLPRPVLRPLDLLTIGCVGLVTAVLAALLPARTVSRQNVTLALTGRREHRPTAARVPVAGALAAAAGLAVVIGGVRNRSAVTILAGAALGQVGLVGCTPTLVVAAGRAATLLPLSPRLALRDSARNVSRTAPAVAAVMAAVAGTVATGIFLASTSNHAQRMYVPALQPGQLAVTLDNALQGDVDAIDAAVRRTVPVRSAVLLRGLDDSGCAVGSCLNVVEEPPADAQCPPTSPRDDTGGCLRTDTRSYRLPVAVADATDLPKLTGHPDPAAQQALAAGGAVVFDPVLVAHGLVHLHVIGHDANGDVNRTATVPAAAAQTARVQLPAQVLLSPDAASALGLTVVPKTLLVTPEHHANGTDQKRLSAELDRLGEDASVYVERGYVSHLSRGLLALVIGAAVVTVAAVATSTALAMTDARRDLATMAAVGASRSVRRRMSVSTALILAGLGTALGVVAGAIPGIAAVRALAHTTTAATGYDNAPWQVVIPWSTLAITAVAVPVVAGLLVAAFTRSTLPLTQRRLP